MEKSGSAVFNLYGIQFRYMNNRREGETITIDGKIEKDIVIQVRYPLYTEICPL